ncbi:hypothetical protein [Streptomyces sp. NPDC048606]|uniref:hypothetical protein n=1 Tax=Streptomyces sp. NPDC048606 TaxID=3154726 RepID=UPI003413ED95
MSGRACGAYGALSAAHLDALATRHRAALRTVLGDGPVLRCSLEPHADGPHMELLHDGGAAGTALWARWGAAGADDAVLAAADCPAAAPDGGPCALYLGHPGGHSRWA